MITATLLLLASVQTADPAPISRDHLLVKLRAGTPAREVEALHARVGGSLLRDMPQIGWQIVRVDPARLEKAREAYLAEPAIERADFDRARAVAHVPNDTLWSAMWHMRRIQADLAWDTQRGSPSVKVAIMDTGMQLDHPDLVANVWTNPGEIAGNGIDDDGDGYVDDVHGYDFAYGDPDPDDVYGHGTSCAGLVAAVQDNALGVTGVAPLCRLVAVKAARNDGYFYDSANVPALLYCADIGCKVVSMSFFSDQVTPAERDAIDYCWTHGVLPVAAAGNDSSVLPYYPGAYDHVLSVAAIDDLDNKAWFSDWGSWVDVAAPGVGLSTTSLASSYTSYFAGTSGATPHVAGLAALLFSTSPAVTNAQVRAAIEDTSHSTVQAPYGEYTGYGLVDCFAALQRVQGLTAGSKPGRFLFASPITARRAPILAPVGGPPSITTTIIHGIGFELPNIVRVLQNGLPVTILARTRNTLEVRWNTRRASDVAVEVNGSVIGGWRLEPDEALVYSPSDASTHGPGSPVALGGFGELARNDGNRFTCTPRSDGQIFVQMSVRKLRAPAHGRIDVAFTRSYADCIGGVETVELYDWSSASYPYGSFVTLSTRTITGPQPATVTAALPGDPNRFLDGEGTLYFQIRLNGPGPSGQLLADSLQVSVR